MVNFLQILNKPPLAYVIHDDQVLQHHMALPATRVNSSLVTSYGIRDLAQRGSDNVLSLFWHQAIVNLNRYQLIVNWTHRNKLKRNFEKMHLEIASAKYQPFC